MRRLRIDLNRRNAAGQTPAKYSGPAPTVGEQVIAFEPEDGTQVDAVVAGVNPARSLVLLDVQWNSVRDDFQGVWAEVVSLKTSTVRQPPGRGGPIWWRISEPHTQSGAETEGGHLRFSSEGYRAAV
jgi:hypothetical protein